MKTLLIAASLLLVLYHAHATDEVPPTPVEIIDSSTGAASQMVYALKEKVRASHSFKLVSGTEKAHIQIDVNAIAEDAGNNSFVVAFVWVYCQPNQTSGHYLGNSVGYAGITRWNMMADMILSQTDGYSKDVKTNWIGAKELLEK